MEIDDDGQPGLSAPLARLIQALAKIDAEDILREEGLLPPLPLPETRPTCVYRHFDDQGRLLYVGTSIDLPNRTGGHRRSKHWFHEVHKTTEQWFDDHQEALAAERAAIRDEAPAYNVKGRNLTP